MHMPGMPDVGAGIHRMRSLVGRHVLRGARMPFASGVATVVSVGTAGPNWHGGGRGEVRYARRSSANGRDLSAGAVPPPFSQL